MLERLARLDSASKTSYFFQVGLLFGFQMVDSLSTQVGINLGKTYEVGYAAPLLTAYGPVALFLVKEAWAGAIFGLAETARYVDDRTIPVNVWMLRALNAYFCFKSVQNTANFLG